MNVFESKKKREIGRGERKGIVFPCADRKNGSSGMVSDTENTYKIQALDSGNDSDLRLNHLCSSGQPFFDYYYAVLIATSM